MSFPPSIILTNDDGFDALGLQCLATALSPFVGDGLYIVAPDRCYSGGSQQVTMSGPITVEERGPRQWAIGGTPADCARLALTHLAPECAVVISGINHGGNMGHDIFLSGTVGAAREAALLGATAIAVSHYLRPGVPLDWPRAAYWTATVLQAILDGTHEGTELWNINLPHHEPGDVPMPRIVNCVPCKQPLPVAFTQEDGIYRYDGTKYHTRACESGTDVSACFGGAIAVSRLQVTAR